MLENLTSAFSISFAKAHALVEALVTSRRRESTTSRLRLPLGGTCLPLGVPLAMVSGKGSGPVTTEKLQKHKDEVEAENAGAQETGEPAEDPNDWKVRLGKAVLECPNSPSVRRLFRELREWKGES